MGDDDTPARDPYQQSKTPDAASRAEHLSLKESDAILERQFEMMIHVDDRALRLVRTSGILLGIVFTAFSIAPRHLFVVTNLWIFTATFSGAMLLVYTVVFGIGTIQYSSPIYGAGEDTRVRVRTATSESMGVHRLARNRDEQVVEMFGELQSNRDLLWISQLLITAAIVMFVVASIFILSAM